MMVKCKVHILNQECDIAQVIPLRPLVQATANCFLEALTRGHRGRVHGKSCCLQEEGQWRLIDHVKAILLDEHMSGGVHECGILDIEETITLLLDKQI